jgi:hypothetical protein
MREVETMKIVSRDNSALEVGIDLFNGGEYSDAYEAWNGLWYRAQDKQVRRFIQGLIMTAGAFQLAKKGGCTSAASLLARSIPLLRSGVFAHPDLQLNDFIEALGRLSRDRQWCSSGEAAYDLPVINRENACCGSHARN